jgi:hypothetical protein
MKNKVINILLVLVVNFVLITGCSAITGGSQSPNTIVSPVQPSTSEVVINDVTRAINEVGSKYDVTSSKSELMNDIKINDGYVISMSKEGNKIVTVSESGNITSFVISDIEFSTFDEVKQYVAEGMLAVEGLQLGEDIVDDENRKMSLTTDKAVIGVRGKGNLYEIIIATE